MKKIYLFLTLTITSILSARRAGAIKLENPLGATENVMQLIQNIVEWLVTLGAPVAVGMVVWGALQIMFSGGNSEKFGTGKKTIMYTALGYAIILIGWGITGIISGLLGEAP